MKDLKDERHWIFLPQETWDKMLEVVKKWVKKELADDEKKTEEKPSKNFFKKSFLRSLRGLSAAEIHHLMEEILEGKCFLKTSTRYSGGIYYKKRANNLRTLSLM